MCLFAPRALKDSNSSSAAIGTYGYQLGLVLASLLGVSLAVAMEAPVWVRVDAWVKFHGFQFVVPSTGGFVSKGEEQEVALSAWS